MMGLAIGIDGFFQDLSRQSHDGQQADSGQDGQQSSRKSDWFCSEYGCRSCHCVILLRIYGVVFTNQCASARPAARVPPRAMQLPLPIRPGREFLPLSFPPLDLPCVSSIIRASLPASPFCKRWFLETCCRKAKAHSRLVSGLQQLLKLLPLSNHSPDVPNKTHGQHELFVHIGIWRSVVMRKSNLIEQVRCSSNAPDSNFWGSGKGATVWQATTNIKNSNPLLRVF